MISPNRRALSSGLAVAEGVPAGPPNELWGVIPGVIFTPLVLGLRSFATSTPLPSESSSSPRSLPSSSAVSGTEGIFDGSLDGAFGST